MNRQGQVFLLLTILSVTFLLAISTVLLDIQLSEYSEPSPDSDKLFEAWDNSVTTLEQAMSIQIAQNINNLVTMGPTTDLQGHMNNLESYLNSKGLIASIEVISEYYVPPNAGASVFVTLNTSLYMYLATSSGAKLEVNQLNMTVTYSALTTGLTLVVSKIVNSQIDYLNNAIVTPQASVTNTGNGVYLLPSNGVYNVLTSDNIPLQIIV